MQTYIPNYIFILLIFLGPFFFNLVFPMFDSTIQTNIQLYHYDCFPSNEFTQLSRNIYYIYVCLCVRDTYKRPNIKNITPELNVFFFFFTFNI